MNKLKKNNLLKIIYEDLIDNKIHLLLIFFILFSSFFVIFITYKTKILNDRLLRLHVENNFLKNCHYNLILEKNLLIGYSYFEEKIKKNNMKYLNTEKKDKLFFIYKK